MDHPLHARLASLHLMVYTWSKSILLICTIGFKLCWSANVTVHPTTLGDGIISSQDCASLDRQQWHIFVCSWSPRFFDKVKFMLEKKF